MCSAGLERAHIFNPPKRRRNARAKPGKVSHETSSVTVMLKFPEAIVVTRGVLIRNVYR